MWDSRRRSGGLLASLATAVVLAATPTSARSDEARPATSAGTGSPAFPDPAAARGYLASIRRSPALQELLERSVADVTRTDRAFANARPRLAVLDLTQPRPAFADVRGNEKVYPASVVKFVYLMAAYAWQERGLLAIDASLDKDLTAMIRESSNQATQKVFARVTGTAQGPELPASEYAAFRDKRLAVKKWLQSLGIEDLHAVNPTYDGGGDLFGRDQQFLRDRTVEGGLAAKGSEYPNRQSMTANGTVRLLALLATDRALSPADSEAVRRRMRRDVREQPHLAHRIAGGVSGRAGVEVFSKSGTWGPIYADAGIVRDASGRQFVLAVFTESGSPYRGDAIAQLCRRLADHLLSGHNAPAHEAAGAGTRAADDADAGPSGGRKGGSH